MELFLSLDTSSYDHAKSGSTTVAKTWVYASNSVVLVLAHVRHVVSLLVKELPVEELFSLEGTLIVVSGPVRCGCFGVEAKSFALAHAVNELFANKFSDISIRLTPQGHLDYLRSERGKLRLVLHEGAYAALFVPDEQVLVGLLSVADSDLKLLQGMYGPGCGWLISVDHLTVKTRY